MNKEQTKEAVAVMQGYVDGKTIQYRYDERQEWRTLCRLPNWNWTEADYRIKPEMVKYRRYLWRNTRGELQISVAGEGNELQHSSSRVFVRWIDTEWQEIEV